MAKLTLHCDATLMGLNDMFDNAQADPDALGFAAQLRTKPVKALKNALLFGSRNSRALVLDPEGKPKSRCE